MMSKIYEGEFIEGRVVVWDPKEGSEIYKLGFYGKPVGIPKPKTMEFDVPLALDLIEALYLVEKGILKIRRGDEYLTSEQIKREGEKVHERYLLKYLVYKDLRDKGFVVTPGIKFGCDFAVYEHGPGINHAPFLISIKTQQDEISALEIIRAGRLATTVRKRFIIAVSDLKSGKVRYLMFKWWRP
jgi:tRNA-intron endonuclease